MPKSGWRALRAWLVVLAPGQSTPFARELLSVLFDFVEIDTQAPEACVYRNEESIGKRVETKHSLHMISEECLHVSVLLN